MKFDILKPQSCTGTGRRAIQEDSVFPAVGEASIHDKLFVVADGIGGDGSGYKASEHFCQSISDYFFQNTCPDEPFTDEMFQESLQQASQSMDADTQGIHFALLYLHRHGALAVHVGTSCIYHIRPKSREVLYRSQSDSRAFTHSEGDFVVPSRANIVNVQYGDYFVLMTQGAKDCISQQQVLDVICEPVNDSTKLARMTKLLSDSPDNYSVTIVHVSGVMNEAMDERLKDEMPTVVAAPQRESQPASRPSQEPPKREPLREDPVEEPRIRRHHEEEEKDGGFPVVLVTALVIVALGVLAWWWMRSSSRSDKVEVPAVEVKKDSTKKDTINIMKGEKPKALDLPEDKNKEKKDQEQKKSEEKQSEKSALDSRIDSILANPPVSPDETQPQTPDQPQTPTQPQQPTQELKSEVTPVATPDPGTVTPRPVIPEGE